LQSALARLDRIVAVAVERATETFGPAASRDSFRGLYLSGEQFERVLAQIPGEPLLWTALAPEDETVDLASELGLTPFDLDVLLLAVAPELDLKYERLFGFLQDDVTRKRATVDLALHLLCETAEMRIVRRSHFMPGAPLLAKRWLRLVADPSQVDPPLLAHYLKPEARAVSVFTGQREINPRTAPFCRLVESPDRSWEETALDASAAEALVRVASLGVALEKPARLFFEGPSGAGQVETAEALATELGTPLLTADLARATACHADPETVLPELFSEAQFHGAILFLEGADAVPQGLLASLAAERWLTILSGPRSFSGWFPVSFYTLGADASRRTWSQVLGSEGFPVIPDTIETLSARLKLTPKQIGQTASEAVYHAAWRGANEVEVRDFMHAARVHASHDLAALARKVQALHGWDDLILPEDTKAQLREMCERAGQRRRVLEDWGFDRKLSMGMGTNALFAGPSGSGKTMAVEIISNELQLDAYRIDLSGVVSKYIGETEKNLDRIFGAAQNANVILFFDEADALFGKRSEVRDSHDRYANIEISYLLQKMEEYTGIAILATNLKQNLDDAFVRRLTFSIHFPFPDEASRRRIWKGIWPEGVPLADDVDGNLLAGRFELSGGNILNVALAAAFAASAEDQPVSLRHLLHATRREYQKYGKQMRPDELVLDAFRNGVAG
jgi:SpoVK/Ycf46/Vps4 family AAA+-type ATPase